MKNQKHIAQKAALWFARSRAEDFSAEEQAELDAWLAADSAHKQAFSRLEADWADAALLSATTIESLRPSPCPFGFGRPAWQVAACFLGLILIASVCFFRADVAHYIAALQGQEARYNTTSGQCKNIVLQDGSRLELNGNSKIRVLLSRWRREVQLAYGEVFFQVSPDKNRPFEVNTPQGQVRVLGTSFQVRSRSGHVAVDVKSGAVQVATSTMSGKAEKKVILRGGQGVDYSWAGDMKQPRLARLDEALAWREGKIVFRSSRLAEAARRLKNVYGMRIILEHGLEDLRFTGTFSASNLEEILHVIELSFGLHRKVGENGTIFLGF